MLMLIFVRIMNRNESGGLIILRLCFSFWIDVCKKEILMYDTVRFISIFMLISDFMKGNLRFQIGKVF